MEQPVFQFDEAARDCGALKVFKVESLSGRIEEIAWDSRLLSRPEVSLFIALPGQGRDGHAFIPRAWEKGVRNFLISDPSAAIEGGNFILVGNTLEALQQWAKAHRSRFTGKLIALTGSNGKTIVKEWLGSVCEYGFQQLYKSPRSFNSQIGVPLSLLQMDLNAELALIEAGISRKGEMEKLAELLKPTHGILTHMGDAHAEGFATFAEKLNEKLKLFRGCEWLLYNPDDEKVTAAVKALNLPHSGGFSKKPGADLQWQDALASPAGWTFSVLEDGLEHPFHLPVPGDAALENALLVITAARALGLPWKGIREAVERFAPVSMRTEMITDNPEVTVIADAYNADMASVRNAFSVLQAQHNHDRRILILSDLEHQGNALKEIQKALLSDAASIFGTEQLWLVGPVFCELAVAMGMPHAFPSTEALIAAFDYAQFRHSTVLLKGARRFGLEQLIPHLTRRANATFFKVNMNALAANYRRFHQALPPGTRMMAMVKAFSYGSGSWEVAEALAREGIDYLAVASATEGITLRTRGIRTPVMVMNGDESALDQFFRFNLEPEVFSFGYLQALIRTGAQPGNTALRIHLKVDTGMGRLGFAPEEAGLLCDWLKKNPQLEVASILSHLASADSPEHDEYTRQQVKTFTDFCAAIESALGYRPARHILNTAGVLRFPEYAFDMVRVGIGIYGVSPLLHDALGLEEIGSLHSSIQQIHRYPAHTWVGYGCSQRTKRESRIATVPVGYADGIRRALGNGRMSFLVNGQRAPVFGRICMDMLMLDVTGIPDAREGDEVVLFGRQGEAFISVNELAQKCDTIAYEILSGMSYRVRRVYVRE